MKNNTQLQYVDFDLERYFKITNQDTMRPFFMSIVSDSDHWMFMSSNGGITAGRKNPDFSFFPYYTDDKITESAETTGGKSIFRVNTEKGLAIWEPYSDRFSHLYSVQRNLYKNIYGNKIIFEEINHDLGLTFRCKWQSSDLFGFVKQTSLENLSGQPVTITLLDGLQNIVPFGVPSDLQSQTSNLVDGYKRNELIPQSRLGIFALSAIIVDKAEPSEALIANIAWSLGLPNPTCLLSSKQLPDFRKGLTISGEEDVKGEKGAYFVSDVITLMPQETKAWDIIFNVNQSQSQVIALSHQITENNDLQNRIYENIALGTRNLISLNTAADGVQVTADPLQDARHFSNTLFNIMRGGIFDNGYQIEKVDLLKYLEKANKEVYQNHASFLQNLGDVLDYRELKLQVHALNSPDLTRLCTEYLPLKFSRRHGDPSRPWNKFSINTRSEVDGSKILDYQGNWRDIFQNWEALAHSFPEYMDGMIFKFLNASTFDGYNPYRVTKDGFDWETIEPDNPWSYIGYWGDHQVIYLLKFLEFSESYFPGRLQEVFSKEVFAYAAVPYKIKPFVEIVKNAKDTIVFDHDWEKRILKAKEKLGSDGALLSLQNGEIYRVTFIEKILALVLAKLSNFIPNGGIWMNTQRPEWNDANNALVGNGVSMVTLYYLRRFFTFLQSAIQHQTEEVPVSAELFTLFEKINETFTQFSPALSIGITPAQQFAFVSQTGTAASLFRDGVYQNGFSGVKKGLPLQTLQAFATLSLQYIDNTIKNNKRSDNLYHAYNLVSFHQGELSISYLSEMLEGQVAVLSSGKLTPTEAFEVIKALRNSSLYRPDQQSYILYPNKNLPGFLQKNNVPANAISSSAFLQQLLADGNTQIIEKDIAGGYHFNGHFRNANDLSIALDSLANKKYTALIQAEKSSLLALYEQVFNHKAFTGRSGTFFAFEGLGSIYWHMVSKLLLAVQECYLSALSLGETEAADGINIYFKEIKEGIGVHKSPKVYGAFPTDPYSHTPLHKGAQQPGMTGQVKEDYIARKNELGVHIKNGSIYFEPTQIGAVDFLKTEQPVDFHNVKGELNTVNLPAGALFFLYCQVPVIYQLANAPKLQVTLQNGEIIETAEVIVSRELSQKIFGRTGEVIKLHVFLPI